MVRKGEIDSFVAKKKKKTFFFGFFLRLFFRKSFPKQFCLKYPLIGLFNFILDGIYISFRLTLFLLHHTKLLTRPNSNQIFRLDFCDSILNFAFPISLIPIPHLPSPIPLPHLPSSTSPSYQDEGLLYVHLSHYINLNSIRCD